MSQPETPGSFRLHDHRAIAVIAAIFAAVTASFVGRLHQVALTDTAEYLVGAQHLTDWDSPFHGPLYPLAIAVMAKVVRDEFLAAKLVSLLSGVLCVVSTYVIGLYCFSRRSVAIAGAAMVALSPVVLMSSFLALSDMLAAALFVTAVACLVAARTGSWVRVATAGALCGLAYLARYVHLAGFFGAFVYMLLLFPGTTRQRLQATALFVACFAIVIAPWSAIQIARHGNLYNKNYINIVVAMKNRDDNWSQFREYLDRYPTLLSVIKAEPGPFARFVGARLVDVPSRVLLGECSLAGLFSIPGLFFLARRPTASRAAFIVAGAFALAPTLLVWSESRFYLALFPFVMLAAAYFVLYWVGESPALYWPSPLPAMVRRLPLRLLVLAACLAGLAVGSARNVPAVLARNNAPDTRDVADHLDRILPPGTAIVSHDLLNYYTRRPVFPLANFCDVMTDDLEHAADRVAHAAAAEPSRLTLQGGGPALSAELMGTSFDHRVNVLVYSRRNGVSVCPKLEFLFNPADPRVPRSFHAIHDTPGDLGVIAYWIGPGEPPH